MVFQKKGEKIPSDAHQSINQSSNNTKGRIVWVHPCVFVVKSSNCRLDTEKMFHQRPKEKISFQIYMRDDTDLQS